MLSYDRPRLFPPAERALLPSLTGLIAQALDRARRYDAKHTFAHTLPSGLLPHTLPRLSGLEAASRYRPAGHGMDIGGDFFDLIRCSRTTVVTTIGDVQGHNSTAAALMGQVRTAVHTHAAAGATPGDILTRTNQLLGELNPSLFASCLIAHLDLTRHRAQLATAGHPPALLRHPDRHTDILRLTPGLLLGSEPDADYRTTDVSLLPGTVLTSALAGHLAAADPEDLDALADALTHRAEQAAPRYDDIAPFLLRPTARSDTAHHR
ncbi:PP2C family protein-serine/threonine phosphatase [Streptomyces spiralis]